MNASLKQDEREQGKKIGGKRDKEAIEKGRRMEWMFLYNFYADYTKD